jgi:2-oxoglutarate ferredoxin oxidoreductase subunit alpha
VVNIVRAGPGLGGIQPAQQDYNQATKAPGHGGFRVLVYAPSTVQEMVDMVFTAFDMAEKYLMPAMILADGLLGQMMEPVQFPQVELKPAAKPWAVGPVKGGSGRNVVNSLYLQATKLEERNHAREERYAEIERTLPDAERYLTDDAEVVLVAYGASARVARSAVNSAREAGIKAGLVRPITLWPFPNTIIKDAAKNAKSLLVVEMNSGQMVDDVRLAVECRLPVEFFGRTGGVIPTPAEVLGAIKKCVGGGK